MTERWAYGTLEYPSSTLLFNANTTIDQIQAGIDDFCKIFSDSSWKLSGGVSHIGEEQGYPGGYRIVMYIQWRSPRSHASMEQDKQSVRRQSRRTMDLFEGFLLGKYDALLKAYNGVYPHGLEIKELDTSPV